MSDAPEISRLALCAHVDFMRCLGSHGRYSSIAISLEEESFDLASGESTRANDHTDHDRRRDRGPHNEEILGAILMPSPTAVDYNGSVLGASGTNRKYHD